MVLAEISQKLNGSADHEPTRTFETSDDLKAFVDSVIKPPSESCGPSEGKNCLAGNINWIPYKAKTILIFVANACEIVIFKEKVLNVEDGQITNFSPSEALSKLEDGLDLVFGICDGGKGQNFGKTEFQSFTGAVTTLLQKTVPPLLTMAMTDYPKEDLGFLQKLQSLVGRCAPYISTEMQKTSQDAVTEDIRAHTCKLSGSLSDSNRVFFNSVADRLEALKSMIPQFPVMQRLRLASPELVEKELSTANIKSALLGGAFNTLKEAVLPTKNMHPTALKEALGDVLADEVNLALLEARHILACQSCSLAMESVPPVVSVILMTHHSFRCHNLGHLAMGHKSISP